MSQTSTTQAIEPQIDEIREDKTPEFTLRWTVVTSLVASVTIGLWYHNLHSPTDNQPPPTGALTQVPSSSNRMPTPENKPALEIGEKTKLFMNNNAYLFGTSRGPESAALSQTNSYRVGVGREIERASGARLTGEVSFNMGENTTGASGKELAQTRLTAAYLRQINDQTKLRAGLSTDLSPDETWSTLELQFSIKLEDDLSLKLNHDYGHSLDRDAHEHQTGISLEKRF
ncbi:MAG: hypothetical protein ACPGSC_11650 [Granulosicoccaceae bacterium]